MSKEIRISQMAEKEFDDYPDDTVFVLDEDDDWEDGSEED